MFGCALEFLSVCLRACLSVLVAGAVCSVCGACVRFACVRVCAG